MSGIKFKTYTVNDNNENIENLEYDFNLDIKIIDIKNEILKKSFDGKYNSLELFNITPNVYKDFGKLFFDKGLLPDTFNNYKLSEFTIANRTFSFIISAKNIEHVSKKINQIEKNEDARFVKKLKYEKPVKPGKNKLNELIFNDTNFPPLS